MLELAAAKFVLAQSAGRSVVHYSHPVTDRPQRTDPPIAPTGSQDR